MKELKIEICDVPLGYGRYIPNPEEPTIYLDPIVAYLTCKHLAKIINHEVTHWIIHREISRFASFQYDNVT
jgi:predicted SprT family Zn-dependent metalloprotease